MTRASYSAFSGIQDEEEKQMINQESTDATSAENMGRRSGNARSAQKNTQCSRIGKRIQRPVVQESTDATVEHFSPGRNVDGRDIIVQFAKYGPNVEPIKKGKIIESLPKARGRSSSRSPRPRMLQKIVLFKEQLWSSIRLMKMSYD